MSRSRSRASKKPVILGILAGIIVVAGILYFVVWKPAKAAIVSSVAEKTITSVAEQAGVDADVASEIYDNMSEEDQETVQDLIDSHADASTVQEAVDLYTSGDTEGLKDLAQSELSDDEMEELYSLYQKYVAQ